jgi:hypothetical protein
MPSHPIATWNTPCNSPKVQPDGTSTRRHTIGLMPSNHTLICTIASASEADGAGSSDGRGGFGRGFIQPDYRLASRLSPDTPRIVMLSAATTEDAVPGWLVLGVTLRVETIRTVSPMATPAALCASGFLLFEEGDFVGRFGVRLQAKLAEWAREAPRSPLRRWLRRASALLLSPTGDLLHPTRALAEALAVPSWLDPTSGEVRR